MHRCLVSFGANMGDPLETIRSASRDLATLVREPHGSYQLSGFYRTPPVGGPGGQPPFVNAVAAFETAGSVWDIWSVVRELEKKHGRVRNQRWEARSLDVDILLFDQQRIWTPHLKVPHPRMCMRRFMLIPAAEIVPNWIDPVTGSSIQQLAERLDGSPGSLTLIAFQSSAKLILEEAARSALATWVASDSEHPKWKRWVEWSTCSNAESVRHVLETRDSPAKLTVLLMDPIPVADAAWEDYYRRFAQILNLDERPGPTTWNAQGARYLLAADDPSWASHELIAALEAMDCPVERV